MSPTRLRKPLIGLVIAVASTLAALLLYQIPLLRTMEWKIYDLEFRALTNASKASPDIVMITIDDESVERMDQALDLGRFPWPRDVYRDLLNYLERARPRAITFDILFIERDKSAEGPARDQDFVEATRGLGNVIHAIEVDDTVNRTPKSSIAQGYQLSTEVEEHSSIKLPFDSLANASRMLGSTFMALDADGPVRRLVPFVRQGSTYYPALAIATAMVALNLQPTDIRLDSAGLHLGDRLIPLMEVRPEYAERIRTRHMLVNYRGPAYADPERKTTTYRSYRFCDVYLSELQIEAGEKPSVDPQVFRDKIVFAGFGRADELDADEHGLAVTANAGYDATGLKQFLTTLKERNAGSEIKQGLFASHPEMDERLQKIDSIIQRSNWSGGAVDQARLQKYVKYKPVPLAEIAVIQAGTAGLARGGKEGEEKKKDDEQQEPKKKSRFSLAKLKNPLGGGEEKTQSAEVTGSGGSRGVDKERLAKGGSNPTLVAVIVTDQEIQAFIKEGNLKA